MTKTAIPLAVLLATMAALGQANAQQSSAPRATTVAAVEPSPANQQLLVQPDVLEQQLARPNLRVLDTRSRDAYTAGHIPGAVWVDVPAWQALGRAPGGFRDADAWGERVSALGLGDDTQVVVYGDRLPDAARVWWTLKYLGHEHVALLDGGWPAWIAGNRATDAAAVEVATREFKPQFQSDRLQEIDDLKQSHDDEGVALLDTRSLAEFTGEDARGPRGGHIAGATHLDWSELITADGRFKPRDELKRLFREHGVLPDDTAVCY